jgi:hypothetical protein
VVAVRFFGDKLRATTSPSSSTFASDELGAVILRNLTIHTYNPAVAETVYQSAKAFLGDARYLLEQLRARAQ